MTDDTNHHDDTDQQGAVDPGTERSSKRRPVGIGIGAALAAVGVIAGAIAFSGGGDDADGTDASSDTTVPDQYDAPAFCAAVADLPRIADSLDEMGTPATGFRSYADGLDAVAAVADSDTSPAVLLLADRYRSMADAVERDAETAPGDGLAAAAQIDADVDSAAAIETLRATIADDC